MDRERGAAACQMQSANDTQRIIRGGGRDGGQNGSIDEKRVSRWYKSSDPCRILTKWFNSISYRILEIRDLNQKRTAVSALHRGMHKETWDGDVILSCSIVAMNK